MTHWRSSANYLVSTAPIQPSSLAGGGNTSCKIGNRLYVKASGTSLATMDRDSFVTMDRDKFDVLANATLDENSDTREAQYKAAINDARCEPQRGQRPSVEVLLHHLVPSTYVVHSPRNDCERACMPQERKTTRPRNFWRRHCVASLRGPRFYSGPNLEGGDGRICGSYRGKNRQGTPNGKSWPYRFWRRSRHDSCEHGRSTCEDCGPTGRQLGVEFVRPGPSHR